MATWYAMQHNYGANAGDARGDHIGRLAVFRSRAARDEWVADGNPYYTQSGARTALQTKGSRADRRAIKEFTAGRNIRSNAAASASEAWDVEGNRDVMPWEWVAR